MSSAVVDFFKAANSRHNKSNGLEIDDLYGVMLFEKRLSLDCFVNEQQIGRVFLDLSGSGNYEIRIYQK
jgi:hypothetical protein